MLGDPRLRRELIAMVRRRVPSDEVDDIVQATLTEALSASSAPDSIDELRRWIWGIARHKVADLHRKKKHVSADELPETPGDDTREAREARDLLRWAESELPEGENAQQTLGWLLREGEGEKLEHIAEAERLPAPRVRQRVTRLRQHFRARWQAQLAAVATLVGAVALLWWWRRPAVVDPVIVRDMPVPTAADPSIQRANSLRQMALAQCEANDLSLCTIGLDEAKKLDPNGEQQPAVIEARARVAAALKQVEDRKAAASASAVTPQASGSPAVTAPQASERVIPSAAPPTTSTPTPPKQKGTGDSLGPFGDRKGSDLLNYGSGAAKPSGASKQGKRSSPEKAPDVESAK